MLKVVCDNYRHIYVIWLLDSYISVVEAKLKYI